MDFDSCIRDLCNTCYSTCQSYHTLLPQHLGNKKSRRSPALQDKCKSDIKCEKPKCTLDFRCNCPNKQTNQGKMRQDKSGGGGGGGGGVVETNMAVDKCRHTFSHPGFGDDRKSKLGRCFGGPEEVKECKDRQDRCFASDKSSDGFSDLQEKVNFLFRLFKDEGDPHSRGEFADQNRSMKIQGISLRDIWELFNLNKRMSAAEEGLEKLTMTVQELLNKITKLGCGAGNLDDFNYCEPTESNEMTPGKTIAVLKNRNDLLISLMKTFLKIGTVDEIYSKLALMPKNGDSIQSGGDQPLRSNATLNQEEIMDTLKSLREQIEDMNISAVRKFSAPENVYEDGEGNDEAKYTRSKLEVITEQAEYNAKEKFDTKGDGTAQNYQYGLCEDEDDDASNDKLNLRSTATRLLSQDILDEVHYNHVPQVNPVEKNTIKSVTAITDQYDTSKTERKMKCEINSSSNCPRDGNSSATAIMHENERKLIRKDALQASSKYSRLGDFKGTFKAPVPNGSCGLSKPDVITLRQDEIQAETEKKRLPRKIINKGSCTSLLRTPSKSIRPGYFSPDLSAGRRCNEVTTEENLRPMTAPNSAQKSMLPTDLRKLPSKNILKPSLILERTKKGIYNSGNSSHSNNVRSLNKSLISKKIFVQTP